MTPKPPPRPGTRKGHQYIRQWQLRHSTYPFYERASQLFQCIDVIQPYTRSKRNFLDILQTATGYLKYTTPGTRFPSVLNHDLLYYTGNVGFAWADAEWLEEFLHGAIILYLCQPMYWCPLRAPGMSVTIYERKMFT